MGIHLLLHYLYGGRVDCGVIRFMKFYYGYFKMYLLTQTLFSLIYRKWFLHFQVVFIMMMVYNLKINVHYTGFIFLKQGLCDLLKNVVTLNFCFTVERNSQFTKKKRKIK